MMKPLPENLAQVYALDVGDSVCDMHDGFPHWWPLDQRAFKQAPQVATVILQSACKDRGEGYLNKMLVVVAKYRGTVVLGYCKDGSYSFFYYLNSSALDAPGYMSI
jgi:hypothetical protein